MRLCLFPCNNLDVSMMKQLDSYSMHCQGEVDSCVVLPQYFVTWDAGLVFAGPNQAPMDYQSQPPLLIPADQARMQLLQPAPSPCCFELTCPCSDMHCAVRVLLHAAQRLTGDAPGVVCQCLACC
jgi:hypothetical protein